MNKAVGAAIGIISLIIAFVFFPNVMRTAEEIKVKEVAEDHLVATAVGETSATFVLYNGLYDANLSYIVEVNSSDTSDSPVGTTYNSVTRELTVGGLVESVERTLQVKYKTDALGDATGVRQFNSIAPFLIMGALISIGCGVIWHVFRSR